MSRVLNNAQFEDFLGAHLGDEARDPYYRSSGHPLFDERGDPRFDPSKVEGHVFRAMSEQHYQRSLRQGWHASDERGNYIGQSVSSEREGTVAGRWAYPGYLTDAGVGRVVKIKVRPDEEWRPHPDDDEGGYVHTFKRIPTKLFVARTTPVRFTSRGWEVQ